MENNAKYSHLLVLLGNGFDLAHGLKTSYSDLMDYLLEETRNNSTKTHPFIKLDKNGVEDPYLAITHSNQLNKNVLTTKPNSDSVLFRYLFENFETTKTWGDFEEIYFRLLYNSMGGQRPTSIKRINTINDEFEHLKNLLEEYLLEIENNINATRLLDDSPEIIKLLSEKAKDYVTVNLINFNYTTKISKELAALLSFRNMRDASDFDKMLEDDANVFHIHGQLNSSDNPIIFGYGNDQSEKFKQILNHKNDELLKYFKTFLYKENNVSKYVNDYLIRENIKVIVIGHSLSDTDSSILNKIFKHKNVKSIGLVYHQDKSKYKKNLIQFARIVDDQNIIDQKVLSREETGFIP